MMPAFSDYWGILAAACLCVHGVAWLLRQYKLAWRYLGLVVLLVLPYQGVSVAGVVAGLVGDISTLTVLLMLQSWLRPLALATKSAAMPTRAWCLIAGAGLMLWVSLFWYLPFDLYRVGYQPDYWFCLLLAAGVWFMPLRLQLCIALSVLGWWQQTQSSSNLWDYLLDPILVGYALTKLSQVLLAKRAKKTASA